jgi:hypothetical protein
MGNKTRKTVEKKIKRKGGECLCVGTGVHAGICTHVYFERKWGEEVGNRSEPKLPGPQRLVNG